MNLLENLKHMFNGQETGFKVVGNHWFARYSNAFEDREGEYFPIKAIDNYIARVDTGVTPAPDLWVWHEPITIGKALTVARIGNFAVAAGYFHETPLGQAAKQYLSTHKAKLSHGFMFEPEAFKDNAYHDYNTFEISVLPFDKGVAANAYTNIEVKDMKQITDQKRAFFEEMFGKDTTQELIANTEKASKALEEAGARYKDFTDVQALKAEGDTPDAKKPMMEDDEEDTTKTDEEKSFGLKDVVADLFGDFAELADGQNTVAKALQDIQDQNKELLNKFEQAQASNQQTIKTLQDENKALRDELALTPTRASQANETELNAKEKEAFEKDLKQKESSQKDDFFSFMLDK